MEQQCDTQQSESMCCSNGATEFNKTESTEPAKGSEAPLRDEVLMDTLHRFCKAVQLHGIDNILVLLEEIEPQYPLLKGK